MFKGMKDRELLAVVDVALSMATGAVTELLTRGENQESYNLGTVDDELESARRYWERFRAEQGGR